MALFSGCQQKGTTTNKDFSNIILNSEVVELVYSVLNFNKDQEGVILSVEVQYRFRNIVNRNIDVNVFVEFYDVGNNLLAKEGPKEINLPKGWVEQGVSPANIINYRGENVDKVDHAIIIVEEKV
jgi:hypothetical protein